MNRRYLWWLVLRGFALASIAKASVPMLPREGRAQQSANTSVRFAQHDMRGASEADIVLRATHSSVNGVSLVVRTTNRHAWKTAYQTAKALAEEGYPVSLLLAADGPDRLEVYAGSIEIGRINHPSGTQESARVIRGEMIRAHDIAFGSQ